MEKCETRVRITTKAMRLLSLAASCLIAHGAYAATWTGANGTDLADPLNWSGDVYSTEMQFSSDAALTLNNDTNVFRVFGTSGNNRKVTIDLSGHNLGTTAAEYSNRDFWRATGTTFVITNSSDTSATFTQKSILVLDNTGYTGTRLVVAGKKTFMNGSIQNRGGVGCQLDLLDGATLSGSSFYLCKNFLTNNVANCATLNATDNIGVGSAGPKPHDTSNGPWHGNLMSVSGAAVSADKLIVGCGQLSTTGAPYDNIFMAYGGATVTLSTGVYIGCGAAATNNSAVMTGAGTVLSTKILRVGTRTAAADGTIAATLPATNNLFAVEKGATVEAQNIYIGAGGNLLVVNSGATLEAIAGGLVQLSSDMTAETTENAGGHIGSRVEIVGGTLHYLNRFEVGRLNEPYRHEVFVGDGGILNEKPFCFCGSEGRLVVSNGTVNVTGLNMRYADTGYGSNNTVRIMGESGYVQASSVNFTDAAASFEFVIPETGWSEAPFRCLNDFTIPADFRLNIDKASAKAYRNAMKARGEAKETIPLMRALSGGGYAKTITIADETTLSANLPEGCALKNQDGVLSVEIRATCGLMLFFR